MKKRNYKHYIRRAHRYLGIIIGIQFLFWTIGGLYFSWTKIEEVRGEHLRKTELVDFGQEFVSPTLVIDKLAGSNKYSAVTNIRLIEVSGKPFYEFAVVDSENRSFLVAADAVTGEIRPAVTQEEAVQIANHALEEPFAVKSVAYLTEENVGGHHEYREKPLPAWAVTYENDLTIYISAETGHIGAFRTNKWRIFDFLWMLHTMDFEERDDFNNYLLRGFSVLGLITVLSGFLLFFVSSKRIRGLFLR